MLSMYFAAGHMRYERCDASLLSWPSPLVIACLISMKFDGLDPQTFHLIWRVRARRKGTTKGFGSKRVLPKSYLPATSTCPEATPDLTPDRLVRVRTCISICPTAAMLHLESQSMEALQQLFVPFFPSRPSHYCCDLKSIVKAARQKYWQI